MWFGADFAFKQDLKSILRDLWTICTFEFSRRSVNTERGGD